MIDGMVQQLHELDDGDQENQKVASIAVIPSPEAYEDLSTFLVMTTLSLETCAKDLSVVRTDWTCHYSMMAIRLLAILLLLSG
jgi:hypothetical protein